jgi:hypothetical protein
LRTQRTGVVFTTTLDQVFKVQKLLLVPYFMRFFTSETGSGVQSPKIAAGSLLHEVLYF